jgi:hypothetical protein
VTLSAKRKRLNFNSSLHYIKLDNIFLIILSDEKFGKNKKCIKQPWSRIRSKPQRRQNLSDGEHKFSKLFHGVPTENIIK